MLDNVSDNKAPRGSISQIILKSLTSGDKYGYEICKYIEKSTDGKLILKQPSLYSSLRRMELQGLISSYWQDSELGGRRHYYKLTPYGQKFIDENKDSFLSDEELINNLPQNEKPLNTTEFSSSTSQQEQFFDTTVFEDEKPKTSVIKQENLFTLAKVTEKVEPVKTNEEKNANNNSFFQFDLFNERMSFVKDENKEAKQDIPTFTNKYQILDNHNKEIEPTNLNVTSPDNRNDKEKDSLFDVKNEEFPKVNLFNRETEQKLEEKQNSLNNEKISWEDSKDALSPTTGQSIDDYKSVIGQLYNNSRLQDPYEENKFQTFKEIFPASKLNQEEKVSNEDSDEKLSNLIKSSEESNIDCEDIRNLNNLYNLQGIEIKLHDKNENKKENKIYTDKNKLKMVASWILSAIMLLEILFSYLIFKGSGMIQNSQRMVFYLSIAFVFSYCIIATLENFLDRYRLVIINKKLKRQLMIRIFIFILLIISIFTINILFGMSSLLQKEFFVSWFVPSILSTNILVFVLTYHLLLKSNAFSK